MFHLGIIIGRLILWVGNCFVDFKRVCMKYQSIPMLHIS